MSIERGSTFEPYRSVNSQAEGRTNQEIIVPRERQEVGMLAHEMVVGGVSHTVTLAAGSGPDIKKQDGFFRRVWESTPMVWLRAAGGTAVDLFFLVGISGALAAGFGGAVSPVALLVVGTVMAVWGMYSRIKTIRKWQKERNK